jgi:hypothetical protein
MFTLYYVHFFSFSVHKYLESRSLCNRLKLPVACHGESSKCEEVFSYYNSLAKSPPYRREECARGAFSKEEEHA